MRLQKLSNYEFLKEAKRIEGVDDLHVLLNVKTSATSAEIKKEYTKYCLYYHSDKATGIDKTAANEMFTRKNYAYEVLKDPEQRSRYIRYTERYGPKKANEYMEQQKLEKKKTDSGCFIYFSILFKTSNNFFSFQWIQVLQSR